ncbi:MAG: hypothetical protein WBC04_15245, partial [Candidatus Acidiferrales bacterium]
SQGREVSAVALVATGSPLTTVDTLASGDAPGYPSAMPPIVSPATTAEYKFHPELPLAHKHETICWQEYGGG